MTDLAPGSWSTTPAGRLAPIAFAHARVAMLVVSADGLVVDVNRSAEETLGRFRFALVQEPLDRHVTLQSGEPLPRCLRAAALDPEPRSYGPCTVHRSGGDVARELVVSSGYRISGRELLLVQLATTEG